MFIKLSERLGGALSPRVLRLVALLLGGMLAVLGITLAGSGRIVLGFEMLWNLFLALLPLGASLVMVWLCAHSQGAKKRRRWLFWLLAALWLCFFPNAPYMFTDLIHLNRYTFWANGAFTPSLLAWAGFAHVALASLVGFMCGCLSLWLVQGLVRTCRGRAAGWLFSGGVSLLCGAAIYIGRFLRFNSWDLVRRPLALLDELAGRLGWHTLGLCLLFAAATFGGYVLFDCCFNENRHPA